MNLTPTQIICVIIFAIALVAILHAFHLHAARKVSVLTDEQLAEEIYWQQSINKNTSILRNEQARRSGSAA